MIKLIETPHLPEGKVRHVIIGKKYKNLLENALKEKNIEVLWLDDNTYVDERLSGHADLSSVHIGKNKIILSKFLEERSIVKSLTGLGYRICFTTNPKDKNYPYDAGLNICIVGDNLIYNPASADNNIIKTIVNKNLIDVKQGYTKCSICVVDNKSIITSDFKIYEKALTNDIDALYINKPFVKLDGFEYGFIGGSSFKINKNEIAFTGQIKDIETKNLIEEFLYSKNVKPIYLTDQEIFDIGSAIVLTEET